MSAKKKHKHAGLAGVGFITDSALAKLLRKMKEESMLADDDGTITPQPIMQSHSYHNSQLTNCQNWTELSWTELSWTELSWIELSGHSATTANWKLLQSSVKMMLHHGAPQSSSAELGSPGSTSAWLAPANKASPLIYACIGEPMVVKFCRLLMLLCIWLCMHW